MTISLTVTFCRIVSELQLNVCSLMALIFPCSSIPRYTVPREWKGPRDRFDRSSREVR
jgi:hypothetical protein